MADMELHVCVHSYANEAVTSLPPWPGGQYGQLLPIFGIFGLKLLSTFSSLDNK